MKRRTAKTRRKTGETDIAVELNLDGTGVCSVATGIPFMDHMLELLSHHSLIDMKIRAKGDLDVDYHHTVEDLGLCIGEAVDKALGDRRGIMRYGCSLLPMDDALSQVALDLGGRPFMVLNTACRKRRIKDFDVGLVREFLQALTVRGRMNLHVSQLYGDEAHHAYESVFKGIARALRVACSADPRNRGIPSSKGKL